MSFKTKHEALTLIFKQHTPLPNEVSALIIEDVLEWEHSDGKKIWGLHNAIRRITEFVTQRSDHMYSIQIAKCLMDQEQIEYWEYVSGANPHYNLWMYVRYHRNIQPVVQRLKIICADSPFGYTNDADDFIIVNSAYYDDLDVPEPEMLD